MRNPNRLFALGVTLSLLSSAAFGQVIWRNGDDNGAAERERARIAALAQARGQVDRARQLLDVAQQRVQANWKANPQYLAAVKEQQAAKSAFDVEHDRVIQGMSQNYEYQEAKQAHADAAADVSEAQKKANATQPTTSPLGVSLADPTPEQMAAAQAKLDEKSKVRRMENEAIATDPIASQAKARLDKANSDLQTYSVQLKAVLLNDPDYKSALDQLTQAKAQMTAAAGS